MTNAVNTLPLVKDLIKRAPRTRRDLEEKLGISSFYAADLLRKLRSQLFIIDYEHRGGKGQPSPKYSFRILGTEEDKPLVRKPRKSKAKISPLLSARKRLLAKRQAQIKAATTKEERDRLRMKFKVEDKRTEREEKRRREQYRALYMANYAKYGRKEDWPQIEKMKLQRILSQDMAPPVRKKKEEPVRLLNPFDAVKLYSANQGQYKQRKAA